MSLSLLGMEETVAAVSLVATIAQLIDFSSKVISRIVEFQGSVSGIPKTFKGLETELPLILNTLEHLSTHAKNGGVDDETERVLVPVMVGCYAVIKSLYSLLNHIVPLPSNTVLERGVKAALSIRKEKETEKLVKNLT